MIVRSRTNMKASHLVALLLLAVAAIGGFFVLGGNGPAREDTDPVTSHVGRVDPDLGKAADPVAGLEKNDGRRVGNEAPKQARTVSSVGGAGSVRARLLLHGKPLTGAEVSVVSSSRKAKAGADGVVRLDGLARGSHRLRVDHEDVARGWHTRSFTLSVTRELDLGDVHVPAACGVRGRVTRSDHTPIASARVYLRTGLLAGVLGGSLDKALTATTDGAGKFTITRVAQRNWTVTVDHADYCRGEVTVDLTKPGMYVDLGDIELVPGRQIGGLVVNERGVAVADASVSYEHRARTGGDAVRFYAERRAVKTDAQGRFVLRGLPESVRLKVVAIGYEVVEGREVPDNALDVRIELSAKHGVAGRVINLATAGDTQTRVWLFGNNQSGSGLSMPMRRSAEVDESGAFFFADVAPGVYRVMADAKDFGASKPRRLRVGQSGVSDIELSLVEGSTVEVTVTEGGKPVAGARVRLHTEVSDGFADELAAPRRVATTGDDGLARLKGAWPGRGKLRVSHESYLPAQRDNLRLAFGVVRVSIQLERGGWIKGRCTDTNGQGIAGISVSARTKPVAQPAGQRIRWRVGRRESPLSGGGGRVTSDKDGAFMLGPFRPGDWLVEARRKPDQGTQWGAGLPRIGISGGGWADASAEARVQAGEKTEVVLRLHRPGSLQGAVTYHGRPVSGAKVFARRKAGANDRFGVRTTKADREGRYSHSELGVGTWLVSAKPANGPVATTPVEVRVREGAKATQDIELSGSRIAGQLRRTGGDSRGFGGLVVEVSEAGGPVWRQRIALARVSDGRGSPASTTMSMRPPDQPEPVRVGKDGRFTIDFVPAGQWNVRVQEGEKLVLWTKEVEVGERQLVDVGVIELARRFPVALKILDPDGKPVPLGMIRVDEIDAEGKPGKSVYSGMTRGGTCKISGLLPGRFKMTFTQLRMNSEAPAVPTEGELRVANDGTVTGTTLRVVR